MPIGPIILFPWYKAFQYLAMPYNMEKGWIQGYTAHQFVQTNPPVHTIIIIINLEVNYSKNRSTVKFDPPVSISDTLVGVPTSFIMN